MTTPPSLLNSTFTSLGSFSYSNLLADDYCHKKFGTFKLKGSTAKNSSFNYKANLQLKSKDKTSPEVLSLTDEYKIGFSYDRFYLQTKICRNGELELHLDGGDVNVGKKVNTFATVKTNLNLANFVWQLGFNYFGPKCESNARFETSKGEHELVHRTIVNEGSFKYGYVGSVSLDKLALKRYDAYLEYSHNDLIVHVEHLSPAEHPDGVKLGKVILGTRYKLNDSTAAAIQVKNNFAVNKLRAVLGVQHQLRKNITVKAKIDSKGKLTGVTKVKTHGVGITVGAQLNLQNGANCVNFNKRLPLPLGFTLDYEA